MRKGIRLSLGCLLVGLALDATAAPVVVPPPVVATAPSPAAGLRLLVARYWAEFLALHPLEATRLGEHTYDAELPNSLAAPHIAQEYDLERRALRGLAAIDVVALSAEDLLTYDVFKRGRERAIEGFRYPEELLPEWLADSVPQRFAELGSGGGGQPFVTTADYERWLKRVDGFVIWMDQAVINLRRGSSRGYVAPRSVVERLLPEFDRWASVDPSQSRFLAPVQHFPATVPVTDQPRLRAAFESAVRTQIHPAYRRLQSFLKSDYLPRARLSVGWRELPLGEGWYAYRVRAATTTHMTPDEIHRIGLDEVRRLSLEIDRVAAELGLKGDRRAVFDAVRADPRFQYESETELLAAYADVKTRVRARLSDNFGFAPRPDFEIRPAGTGPHPSPDAWRGGVLYLNTTDLKSRPRYATEAGYLHDTEPGRHFQAALQLELRTVPGFRRQGRYEAYLSGWAQYSESLGRDLGLYGDPYSYFAYLSNEIVRASAVVVDTGIHAKGWSRQQAIDYFSANTPFAPAEAALKTDQCAAAPAEALAGPIGALRIRAQRLRAERELGARFDPRTFHRAVLADGALPIDVLEARLDRWLVSQKVAP
jgi:uncharacterized protein (DUF885 family)